MVADLNILGLYVHYRIGRLEISINNNDQNNKVHYRIGSLENSWHRLKFQIHVHYRRGSLEKDFFIRNLNCSKFDLYSFLFYYLLGDAE